MIVHLEKNGVRCSLHQTLNGFLLKTNFNPLKNLNFLQEMQKSFHVIGAENELENGYNGIVFNTYDYNSDNIIDTISRIIEDTVI